MNERSAKAPLTELLEASEGLLAAGQASVVDHVALLLAEGKEELRVWAQAGTALSAVTTLAAFGWVLLVVGAAMALSHVLDPALAVLLLGGMHLAAGILGARKISSQLQATGPTPRPPPALYVVDVTDG